MTKTITIRKGLDIKLLGVAEHVVTAINPDHYAIKPTDFHGVLPKLLVAEGDRVLAGSPLFYDKYNERIRFTAPVSGTVEEIRRGAKRLLEEIVIRADADTEYLPLDVPDLSMTNRDDLVELLLKTGLWPVIRQRPYNVIAKPDQAPKAVFISAFDSAPLAPDMDFLVHNKGAELQVGVDALKKLSGAVIHLSVHTENTKAKEFLNLSGVQLHRFEGPHPAGNPGIQIHHIDPVNKGEVVWVVNPMDVVMIGRLFLEKRYNTERVFAFTGSEVAKTQYFKAKLGASVKKMVDGNIKNGELRFISGNVLTGNQIRQDGFIGFYDHMTTVIPEGRYSEFMGWAKPGFDTFSFSNTFLSTIFHKKPFRLDTNLHGGERAYVITGQYEKVLPMDIFPVQLIKAIMINDIDLMENLGIYEVDEEDFALCEVICTSKMEVQSIIRQGLDLIRKEMS